MLLKSWCPSTTTGNRCVLKGCAPGGLPCESWSPAAARSLPHQAPPTQSDVKVRLTLLSQDLFSYFKTSSTPGSKAATWCACWSPILGKLSATWSAVSLEALGIIAWLHKPGHWTEEGAEGTVDELQAGCGSAGMVLLQTNTFVNSVAKLLILKTSAPKILFKTLFNVKAKPWACSSKSPSSNLPSPTQALQHET